MTENKQENPFIPVKGLLGMIWWGLIKKRPLMRFVTADGEEAIVAMKETTP